METITLEKKKGNSFLDRGLKPDGLVLLIILVLVLAAIGKIVLNSDNSPYMYLYPILFLMVAALISVLVADIDYTHRSRVFWFLGTGLAIAVGVLFFGICIRLFSVKLLLFLTPVALFYFVAFSRAVKDSGAARANPERIKSVKELIKICFKSKGFSLLFVLTLGAFLFLTDIIRQTAKLELKEEMEGVFVIIFWILAAFLFLITIVSGMVIVTSKIRKSATSVILFSIMTAAIPIFIIGYLIVI